MRISDWSSDVCSSDLAESVAVGQLAGAVAGARGQEAVVAALVLADLPGVAGVNGQPVEVVDLYLQDREVAQAHLQALADRLGFRVPADRLGREKVGRGEEDGMGVPHDVGDRKSTRLNSSH